MRPILFKLRGLRPGPASWRQNLRVENITDEAALGGLLQDVASSVQVTQTFSGLGAATLADLVSSGTATQTFSSSLAKTLQDVASSTSGTETFVGTSAGTLASLSSAFAAGQTFTALMSGSLGGVSSAFAGAQTFQAAASPTLEDLSSIIVAFTPMSFSIVMNASLAPVSSSFTATSQSSEEPFVEPTPGGGRIRVAKRAILSATLDDVVAEIYAFNNLPDYVSPPAARPIAPLISRPDPRPSEDPVEVQLVRAAPIEVLVSGRLENVTSQVISAGLQVASMDGALGDVTAGVETVAVSQVAIAATLENVVTNVHSESYFVTNVRGLLDDVVARIDISLADPRRRRNQQRAAAFAAMTVINGLSKRSRR